MKKTLLFYNLYPKSNWETITAKILSVVPHDDIIVHVSLPMFSFFKKHKVIKELKKYQNIKQILFSTNDKHKGESVGFECLKKKVDLNTYSLLTYVHSKGSSKPRKNTKEIQDWTELMRYFVIERLDITQQAFDDGFYLSGVNIRNFGHPKVPQTPYHFSGNFVSVNLEHLHTTLFSTHCTQTYFGVEMFWGNLCTREKAFSLHDSHIKNHYQSRYLPNNYRLDHSCT